MSADISARLFDRIEIPDHLVDLINGDQALSLTDREISAVVFALATLTLRIDESLDRRPADERRCTCNAWGQPGLCAHHSYAFGKIREAALKLKQAAEYLQAGQYPIRPS
jgi:hypothetical protein